MGKKRGYLIVRNVPFELADILGGIPKQVFCILKYFHKHSEFNMMFATSREGALPRAVRRQGIPVFVMPELEGNIPKAVQKLKGIVMVNNIKIVQSHGLKESLCCRVLKWRLPGLIHIFRVHTHIDCAHISGWKKNIYHFIDWVTQKYVDGFLCIGHYVANELRGRSRIAEDKIRVIPNGCQDMGEPDMLEDNDTSLAPKLAYVSNIIPFKGHDVLIRALNVLKKKEIMPMVRLVGDFGRGQREKEYRARFKKEAFELGVLDQLEFFGKTEDIRSAVKGCPVLILPSDSEGVPNSILEGMALRKLVVASAVGSIPEMVEDGTHALLHPPQDSSALADTLELIFTRPAKEWNSMREAGYRRFSEKYHIVVMFQDILKAARSLAESKKDAI